MKYLVSIILSITDFIGAFIIFGIFFRHPPEETEPAGGGEGAG